MEEEMNKGVDLGIGLGIKDYYFLSKVKENNTKNDSSAPSLNLSFPLSSDQDDDGIKVKDNFEEEEKEENRNMSSKFKKIIKANCRKKLRLTKEQSDLLECSFNKHSTLIPVQKHSLAEQLNLTPRQVEVWFQNRRARTKLKQTEVDRELLKKRCEILSKENVKLKKELQELKSQTHKKSQLCLHIPMCTSCDQKRPTF